MAGSKAMIFAVGLLAGLAIDTVKAAEKIVFPAPGGQQTVLSVHGATDLSAMEPLIRDFQTLAPNVTIEYSEYVTNDLFDGASRECNERQGTMDLVLSSSVDQLVKLVNDGCGTSYRSPLTLRLPSWTRWRNEIFGFTFEPAVIVFNRNLVPPEDVPRTRVELLNLLRSKPEKYNGKIGSYDIAQSGIGYLFASYDARGTAIFGRLLEAFGRADLVVRCCSSDLLADLSTGRLAIGYNLIGSYAVGAQRRGAPIGIVIPRDYTIVLSRAAFIPRSTRNPATAFWFLDYLLSDQGQKKGREASFFFSFEGTLPEEVDGPLWLSTSGLLRPITIGPELLAVQDRAKRQRLLGEWHRSTQPDGKVP